jgi:phage replication-related protein YjqB (UPF0714/DUF867 family)
MTYRDFSELVLHAAKGKDYRIDILDRGVEITVTAVHGGGIEPLTSELAAAIAGEEHNLYDLRGLRRVGNEELRVPAARFSEMRLQGLLKRSRVAVSVEGVDGAEAAVCLGGRNRRLRRLLAESLSEAGFVVCKPSSPMPSHDPTLFFNAPSDGGVQIEFTRALRESMVGGPLVDLNWEESARRSEAFHRCVVAVREALEQYRLEERSDLDVAMRRFEETTKDLLSMLEDARRDEQN